MKQPLHSRFCIPHATIMDNAPARRCMHLYCKAMAVFGEAFESDPDYQAGMTDFCCLRTQKGCGPDQGEVNLDLCSQPERPCYQEF